MYVDICLMERRSRRICCFTLKDRRRWDEVPPFSDLLVVFCYSFFLHLFSQRREKGSLTRG